HCFFLLLKHLATDVSKSEPDPGLVFHLRFASPSHSYIRVQFSHEAVVGDEDDEAAAM
ncbi:hypothetical protein ABHI18_012413, partial [Aspergillus niger]